MAGTVGLDIRDFNKDFLFHKNIVEENETGGYQILFWKVLPYKILIVIESAIALPKDLDGNVINNLFDMLEDVRIQFMHLVILPLTRESVIFVFYHKRDKLYKNLRHQINSTLEEKILQFLNYVIFAYAENYFISKSIRAEIEIHDKLALLA